MLFRNQNNGCCCPSRQQSVIYAVGPTGPAGPRGETGATGPQGENGTAVASSYGSFFTTASQSVNNEPFILQNTLTSSGITLDTSTGVVTLPNVGVYKVDYGVYVASGAVSSDSVVLQLNGTNVTGTARGLANDSMIDASAIIATATENSTLNIQIVSTSEVTFLDDDGINAYLVIVQIA